MYSSHTWEDGISVILIYYSQSFETGSLAEPDAYASGYYAPAILSVPQLPGLQVRAIIPVFLLFFRQGFAV